MDGTRTARIATLTAAAVVLAAAMAAATLLTSEARGGLDAGRSSAVLTDRTPALLRSAGSDPALAVPHTTPPPTLPEPAPEPVRTAAAQTVEHS